MLIVGERINTSRKRVRRAVEARDAEFIQKEAWLQVETGATMVDVNAGTSVKNEVDDLKWLVEVVQEAVDVPLCIDSPNAKAIEEALKLHKNGRPMINSITAEKARMDEIIPLVKENDTLVVALCMGESGPPSSAADRVKNATAMKEGLEAAGVPLDRAYFDPVIFPASTDGSAPMAAVECIRTIMTEFGGAHTTCGLSNVSYGLPKRNHLNRAFLALVLQAGIDGVIIDPTEPDMMSTLLATRVLLGRDEFCMNYITAEREGKL
ncbi:MAG: dihydropteroate synthase [Planctomycetes bacterium]|nr:dihydropteroate synthase [Planctomycetota bacterium]